MKLHVTLMNTRYREDPHGGLDSGPTPTPARLARESFDASNILRVRTLLTIRLRVPAFGNRVYSTILK